MCVLQPELLKSLSDILKHGGNSPVSRMQAGLQLKNAIYSKDLQVRALHQQRWLQFPEAVRMHVKQNVLNIHLVLLVPSPDGQG